MSKTPLTPHFTLEELTASETADRLGVDNQPDAMSLQNLRRLAAMLEQVKTLLGGKPVMISSGFRSLPVNRAVGSKDTSQHTIGCAADFRIPGMTPDQVVRAIIASNIEYDQVIREFDRWTHISVSSSAGTLPRKQALIIDKAGTRPFA